MTQYGVRSSVSLCPRLCGMVLARNVGNDYCWVPESCEHLKGNATRNGKQLVSVAVSDFVYLHSMTFCPLSF